MNAVRCNTPCAARATRTPPRRALLLLPVLLCASLRPACSQCPPLAEEEPRSRTLRCTVERPCTRFRVASSGDCDHGCATEFIPVGDCSPHIIATDDMQPGKWISCNSTWATLAVYPPEPYPPTCSGKPAKMMTFRTDGVCRRLPIPVSGGQYWQMDCMPHYDPWTAPRLLAIGIDHHHGNADEVTVSSVNTTTRQVDQLYQYNQSLGASPDPAVPAAPDDDGMLYFAAYVADTARSRIVSYEPRAAYGDWDFPSATEHPFRIHVRSLWAAASRGLLSHFL